MSPKGPVTGAEVRAYPDFSSLVAERDGILSSAGAKEGQFTMELPKGRYFFVARGSEAGHEMFAYHGINPVAVTHDYYWLPFFLVEAREARCSVGPQGIKGRVTYKGEPLTNGVVSVYQSAETSFRGMGLLTNTLNDDGLFWFDLEPGPYVVVARKRQSDQGIGPVKRGDIFCYPSANPINVLPESYCEVEISCYPRDNMESFIDEGTENPRGRKEETRRPASLWDVPAQEAEGTMKPPERLAVVSGRVSNRQDKPLAGLFVTAYPALGIDRFQMHVVRLKTDYMARTDENGLYRLELDRPEKYYLVAREKVGEAPNRQEYYGLYEGNFNHSIEVRPGENYSRINITAERIMPFANAISSTKTNQSPVGKLP